MRRPSEPVLVAVLALVATAAFFGEYLRRSPRFHLFSDLEIYHYPLQTYAFEALRHGRLPQWDPSMYCGISFAGNPQAVLFYPPVWLLYVAEWFKPVLRFKALECFVFAHVWLAFLLCYLWLRRRGLEWFPSSLGAGVFAFGGYLLWQIVHLGVVTALAWMPLAFLGVDDSVRLRNWRPLWKTAAASALWFLAGYPPCWVGFCVTIFLYALAGRDRWRTAAWTAAALAASLLLAMVQVLPALEAGSSIFAQDRYGSTNGSTMSLFVANWLDSNRTSPRHYLDCIYVYLGLPAVFAAVWAILRRRVPGCGQPLAVLAACLFLVLDPGHVVYRAIVHVPLLVRTLQDYNFYDGVTLMAALFTALAVAAFLKSGWRRTPPRGLAVAVLLVMSAWSARQIYIWAHGGAFASGGRAVAETAVGVALFAAAITILRAETGARRRWMAAAILVFAFCDFKVYGTNRLFNTRDGDWDQMYTVAGIRGVTDRAYQALWTNRQYRVTSDGAPSSMQFRTWGLASPQGLDPLLSQRYRALIEHWNVPFETARVFRMDYRNHEMLQALGVRYAISYTGAPNESLLASSPDFRLVGSPDSFFHVYEYQRAREPFGWDGVPGEARPANWQPERRVFQVHSAQGGRFGLVEQFFPGWHTRVDGRPVAVERWRDVFQAVAVPPGDHTVVFEYSSRWLPLGAAISLLALAGLIAVARSRYPIALP